MHEIEEEWPRDPQLTYIIEVNMCVHIYLCIDIILDRYQ